MATINHEVLCDMVINHGCVKIESYDLFEGRETPYLVDFEPLLGRAETLAKLAEVYHSAMDGLDLNDPGKVSFLLGSALTGIPLATAVAFDIYRKNSDPSGDFRFGYFVKDEDITAQAGPRNIRNKINRQYPRITILNEIPARVVDYRGSDLLSNARAEAARVLNFQGDTDTLIAAGYGAMPFVVGVALAMHERGNNPYIAFERFSPKAYDKSSTPVFMGSANPSGKAIIYLPPEEPAPFGGRLQDGDNVLIFDDVAARESTAMGAVRKVLRQNNRARVVGMLVGVDRREKEGDVKRLDETLRSAGMELFSVANAKELVERWHAHPEKPLSDQDYQKLTEYQNAHCY